MYTLDLCVSYDYKAYKTLGSNTQTLNVSVMQREVQHIDEPQPGHL